jgi:hypothetical protein
MPPDFDWQKIMEMGKNPGLGIRQLHGVGVTDAEKVLFNTYTPLW